MPRTLAILFALLVSAAAGPAFAQGDKDAPPVTAAQEESALAFVRANHPELAELLDRLESSDRTAYGRAIRDIATASERIGKLRETDPERYAISVRNWTLDSRIRLLTARLTMSDDAELREQLRSLLRERQQGRLELLRLERGRLAGRIEKIDAQIAQAERDQAAAVEQDLARIERAVKAAAKAKKPAPAKPKPDGKKPDAKKADVKKPSDGKKPSEKKPAGGT